MSIFACNGPVVPSAWSFSSCLSDSEAETFESTVPEGVFSDEDYGVALVIDEGGLTQRGSIAGYGTTGRFYTVYPRSVSTAKYVPQDSIFNEV